MGFPQYIWSPSLPPIYILHIYRCVLSGTSLQLSDASDLESSERDAEDDTVEIKYSGAAGANFGTGGLNIVAGDVYSIAGTEVISATGTRLVQTNAITTNDALTSGAVDADNDLLLIYDASATNMKKVTPNDLGITGGDVDRYVDGDTNATGYSTLTATARHVAAAADTLDVLVLSAASSAGKIRVFALLCDVSGVDETDRNTDAQHDG